jgi:hypothetical protein
MSTVGLRFRKTLGIPQNAFELRCKERVRKSKIWLTIGEAENLTDNEASGCEGGKG